MTKDSEKSKAEQVADQCKVVAYLAGIIAEINSDFEKIMRSGKADDLVETWGKRTASFMEQLGDMLNATDSAMEDDEWTFPIFKRAQELWPQSE